MDLTTTYLGLTLRSPLVAAASPLSEDIDNVKRMEDAGAGAVVMHSLFEEQLRPQVASRSSRRTGTVEAANSLARLPEPSPFHITPEAYLEHLNTLKQKVKLPLIASLNGVSPGGWIEYARQLEAAGADALELNIYAIPTEMEITGEQIEQTYLKILTAVKSTVVIPVAIKLSPFFTNMANMARRLDLAGADGLVLFNRFYQPDIILRTLEVEPNVLLSTSQDMRLPLRWIALLYGRIRASLAATSGIHTGQDVVKMLMAGASVTMLCSVLLRHGIEHLREIELEMREWMQEHGFETVRQLQGQMSQQRCADPTAFERAQYMRALQTYRPEWARVYEPSYYFG